MISTPFLAQYGYFQHEYVFKIIIYLWKQLLLAVLWHVIKGQPLGSATNNFRELMALKITLQIAREKELQIRIFMVILINQLDERCVLNEKLYFFATFSRHQKIFQHIRSSLFPACLQGVEPWSRQTHESWSGNGQRILNFF